MKKLNYLFSKFKFLNIFIFIIFFINSNVLASDLDRFFVGLKNAQNHVIAKQYEKGLISELMNLDQDKIDSSKYDVIINLASFASPVAYRADPIATVRGSVLSVWNLLENYNLTISKNSDLAQYPSCKFDSITMWHVLEHVPNLEETIRDVEALLKPNGILIIAVPNFYSFDAAYYKNFWAAFDVPRHLWHFSKASMNKLFSDKLSLLKISPMVFDSFYVSILSEKNKSGKLNLFKAFFVGLRSNIYALSTKEYSSLIYCYQKPE
mgnify:CR=1 FL=1